MKKIALLACLLFIGTTSCKSKNIAIVTQRGYLTITGIEDGYYMTGPDEDPESYLEVDGLPASCIYTATEHHAKTLGIEMPTIFITDDKYGFASSGAEYIKIPLKRLSFFSSHEIDGILAHECAHIKCKHATINAQILQETTKRATYSARAIGLLGYFTKRAYSKHRCKQEYEADLLACYNLRTTQRLIGALKQIYAVRNQPWYERYLPANHPLTLDRIKALEKHLKTFPA